MDNSHQHNEAVSGKTDREYPADILEAFSLKYSRAFMIVRRDFICVWKFGSHDSGVLFFIFMKIGQICS